MGFRVVQTTVQLDSGHHATVPNVEVRVSAEYSDERVARTVAQMWSASYPRRWPSHRTTQIIPADVNPSITIPTIVALRDGQRSDGRVAP